MGVGKEIYVSDYITGNARTPDKEELRRANEIIRNKVLELRAELERLKEEDKNKRRFKRNKK